MTAFQRRAGPPRRRLKADPIAIAIEGARKMPVERQAQILRPIQIAFGRMREGIAGVADWTVLASACNIAMAIELQGVVKGLREHLHGTELALQAIRLRAEDDTGPFPYALHVDEIERLRTFVDLYSFQLGALSGSEFRRAVDYAVAEVACSGGQVLQEEPQLQRQEALQL